MKGKLIIGSILCIVSVHASSQHMNLGITFQYYGLKQVDIKSKNVIPSSSYSYYNVVDNRWKLISAGQSLVIGTVVQVDLKKFYVGIEPSFELNTYDYKLDYPLTTTSSERINFKTVLSQADLPMYVGYQFKSSNVLRYSFFAGAGPVIPYYLGVSISDASKDPTINNRYNAADLKDILYANRMYWNALAGLAIHFANLGRLDIRYVSRMGSPGSQYQVVFHSIGVGMTFFLPLHLLKKRIYYEE